MAIAGMLRGLKPVIRQEWLSALPRIKKTSVVIAAIMLGAGAVNVGAYLTRYGALTFFCTATYAAAFVCDIALPVYALLAGGGNIHRVLFSESAPLMLLVPVRSAVMLLGKQLVNLAEYLIYALSSFVYLTIMAPTAVFMWKALGMPSNRRSLYDIKDYGLCIREFLNSVFRVEWRAAVHITLLVITAFMAVQATLNCASAIYAAFVRTQNAHGKPSRFVMAVLIMALFYIPLRVGTLGIDSLVINQLAFAYRAWPYMARLAAFAIAYFALTAYLIEKKVEVW